MIGQLRFTKDKRGAQLIRITGIDAAQRRNQKIISRRTAADASSPGADRFEWPRRQTRRVRCQMRSGLQQVKRIQRELSRLAAIDESLAAFAPSCQQWDAHVRRDCFQLRGTENSIGSFFDNPVFGLKRLDQATHAIALFKDANSEDTLDEEI